MSKEDREYIQGMASLMEKGRRMFRESKTFGDMATGLAMIRQARSEAMIVIAQMQMPVKPEKESAAPSKGYCIDTKNLIYVGL